MDNALNLANEKEPMLTLGNTAAVVSVKTKGDETEVILEVAVVQDFVPLAIEKATLTEFREASFAPNESDGWERNPLIVTSVGYSRGKGTAKVKCSCDAANRGYYIGCCTQNEKITVAWER